MATVLADHARSLPELRSAPCPVYFTLQRATLPGLIYVGLLPRAQAPLADRDVPGSGVIAVGGWVPGHEKAVAVDFLYVRGT